MAKSFKANIFGVKVNDDQEADNLLSEAIGHVAGLSLEERIKGVGARDRRLEDIERKPRKGYDLLDLTTFKFEGPGRVRPPTPVERIVLDEDESFAHSVAVLYDRRRQLAFVQSAREGMSAAAIAQYFSLFSAGDQFVFFPRLDPKASERARRKNIIDRIQLRTMAGPASSEEAQGLSYIRSLATAYGAEVVNIEFIIKPRSKSSLLRERLLRLHGDVRELDEPGVVERFSMRGRDDEDDKPELIDLLGHQEKRERMLSVAADEREIPIADRWQALEAMHRDFSDDD